MIYSNKSKCQRDLDGFMARLVRVIHQEAAITPTHPNTHGSSQNLLPPLSCPPFIKTSQLAIYHADLTFYPSVSHYHECTHFSVGFPVGGSASNPGRFSAFLLTKADALFSLCGRYYMSKDSSCALTYSWLFLSQLGGPTDLSVYFTYHKLCFLCLSQRAAV